MLNQAESSNVKLDFNGSRRLVQGHPWVRLEDLSRFAPPPPAGTLVRVQDSQGNFLGHAVSDGEGQSIPYRLLSRERRPEFDQAFFSARVEASVQRRGATALNEPFANRGFLRLIHGEADQLPGVFCDRVGSTLLLEIRSPGMRVFEPLILEALKAAAACQAIWSRGQGRWETVYSKEKKAAPPVVVASRAGLKFRVRLDGDSGPYDFEPGESARWAQVAAVARGRNALSAFSRTGMWQAVLALAKCPKVLCLERDAQALARAAENMALNAFDPGTFETDNGDAFQRLESMPKSSRFGVLVADSPASSKSAHGRYLASKQLPELASRVFRSAEQGAHVFFRLRSGGISRATFTGCLLQGAAEAGLSFESLPSPSAPADFPEFDAFPEGHAGLWLGCLVKRS